MCGITRAGAAATEGVPERRAEMNDHRLGGPLCRRGHHGPGGRLHGRSGPQHGADITESVGCGCNPDTDRRGPRPRRPRRASS